MVNIDLFLFLVLSLYLNSFSDMRIFINFLHVSNMYLTRTPQINLYRFDNFIIMMHCGANRRQTRPKKRAIIIIAQQVTPQDIVFIN